MDGPYFELLVSVMNNADWTVDIGVGLLLDV